MADRAISMAGEHAPWRAGIPWWVTGIQAVIAIVIGLFLLLAPASAATLIIQLIALILLIQSVLSIFAALRLSRTEADPYDMVQAGVGLAIGLLLVVRSALLPTLDMTSARTILALGLVAYAVIGMLGALFGREAGEVWRGPLVNAVLLLALAVTLFTSTAANAVDRLAFLGWIALIGGVALALLAWRTQRQAAAATA